MGSKMSWMDIAKSFIYRITHPDFGKLGVRFMFTLAALLMSSPIINLSGVFDVNTGFFRGQFKLDNNIDYLVFLIGFAIFSYGAFCYYKLCIKPDSSVSKALGELSKLMENEGAGRNIKVQTKFHEIFKLELSTPEIEFVVDLDAPLGFLKDYKFAHSVIRFNENRYVPKDSNYDFNKGITWYTRLYFCVSIIAVCLLATPIFLGVIGLEPRGEFVFLGLFIGFIGAFSISPIRRNSCALRLFDIKAAKKLKKDEVIIRKLLESINTNEFDHFIHYGRLLKIKGSFFNYWIQFNALTKASDFHVYDQELRDILNELNSAFSDCYNNPNYFISNADGSLHKFDSKFDIYADESAKKAHSDFTNAVCQADTSFRRFVKMVKENLPNIDIVETNKVADLAANKYLKCKL